jgi:small subunit ribosomal protein S17
MNPEDTRDETQESDPRHWLLSKLDKSKLILAEKVERRDMKLGRVISTKSSKTIVVAVDRKVPHPKYRRIITITKKFHSHDENEIARMGDVVRIVACRPISKLKHWNLVEIVARGMTVEDLD